MDLRLIGVKKGCSPWKNKTLLDSRAEMSRALLDQSLFSIMIDGNDFIFSVKADSVEPIMILRKLKRNLFFRESDKYSERSIDWSPLSYVLDCFFGELECVMGQEGDKDNRKRFSQKELKALLDNSIK